VTSPRPSFEGSELFVSTARVAQRDRCRSLWCFPIDL